MLLLIACSDSTDESTTQSTLRPYSTRLPAGTYTPSILLADTPIPTPTSYAYVIRQGDTLSELAETFNVSQDDLLAANPNLDPNALTVGETIQVPGRSSAAAGAVTPTPAPIPITQTICHRTADSGLWCFALLHNDTGQSVENPTVLITLTSADGAIIASEPASFPLDILPSNASLPAYVYFPDMDPSAQPQAQLIHALPIAQQDQYYLPVELDNTLVQIRGTGFTAQLSGQIHLAAGSATAQQVWVAAVAYDLNGSVIGLRRWEGGPIQPGTSLSFDFGISSAGGPIVSVEFVAQGKP
jgi:LysM repeat protein